MSGAPSCHITSGAGKDQAGLGLIPSILGAGYRLHPWDTCAGQKVRRNGHDTDESSRHNLLGRRG